MITKVLVANRGEIAVRILRACRELRIRAAAVYSEADRHAYHVRSADEAVLIGPPPPLESYLHIDRILDAARQVGADAIHPGYGFLAENADFAARVEEAGLTFIGPQPDVIRLMGDKLAARARMSGAGVPVVPGTAGEDLSMTGLLREAEALGLPLMVKAAAGGGGKGMRVVRSRHDLEAALEGASREAHSAFGDGRVYLERFLPESRHVEIQVFGDTHGHVVHFFERECSIQRRHQKLIEETPSPALDEDLRRKMGAAAVAAAGAIRYRGAGTVEFLLDADGRFYFMEMNTRIQVEHPVTEMTTGVDLVQLQLRVAAGEPLPFRQEDLGWRGHAIECRIYAEDPASDFLPSVGRIALFRVPSGPGVRLDTGVETGDEVSVYYDPILAKLVVHAEDRPRAIARMIEALKESVVLGVATTRGFTRRVLEHPDFAAGRTFTSFIPQHRDELMAPDARLEAEAAAVAAVQPRQDRGPAQGRTAPPASDIWTRLGPWRIGGDADGR